MNSTVPAATDTANYKPKKSKIAKAQDKRQIKIAAYHPTFTAADTFSNEQANILAAELLNIQEIGTEDTQEQIKNAINNTNLVTKSDLRHAIDTVNTKIDAVNTKIDLVELKLEKQIIKSSKETILWLIGIMIVINGGMFAAIGAGFHWW